MFLLSPFHDNYESPAAKIYHDKMGDTLWCFSENRRYYPADVLKKKLMKGNSVASIFFNIWKQLNKEAKESLVAAYDKPVDIIPEAWKENQDKLELFKAGKIDILTHINIIRRVV